MKINVPYYSKASGDISIKAECMNLHETYSLEDCTWAWNGANANQFDTGYVDNGWLRRQSEGIINLNNPVSLPSHFKAYFTFKKTDSMYSVYCILGKVNGTDYTNTQNYHIGNLASSRLILRKNVGGVLLIDETGVISSNTEYNVVYEYDNGTHTVTLNNTTYTSVTDSSVDMKKFFSIHLNSSNYVKDIKIKPL